MSVATALRMCRADVQHVIRLRWADWLERRPELADVDDPADLDQWLFASGPARADTALRAFAWLAAVDGEDDRDAALVLAWVMLPAAQALARRFAPCGISDDQVAAQLWIDVRSYPWNSNAKVAPRLAGLVRRHLVDTLKQGRTELPFSALCDPSPGGAGEAADRLVGPAPVPDRDAMAELLAVLESGCREGVISAEDRALLLDVVAVASEPSGSWADGGYVTPWAKQVSDHVGMIRGVDGRTVRRRTTASLQALAGHYQALRRVA